MPSYMGIVMIVAVCILVLLIGAVRKKAEWLLNFILRTVMGLIGILVVNQICLSGNLDIGVGINLFTIITSGILGLPGIVALYGINLLNII